MAAKRRVEEPEEPEEQPSRAAGGCVLAVFACGTVAVVFAVSPAAGVLAVWVVGAVALWRSARRNKSMQGAANPAPPPVVATPSGDVYAGETGAVARVVRPAVGVTILHPVREEEVNKP